MGMINDFQAFKTNSLQAACDLEYGAEIVKKIRCANTYDEIDDIMRQCRKTRRNEDTNETVIEYDKRVEKECRYLPKGIESSLNSLKRVYTKICEELLYPQSVIDKINEAKDEYELIRIMHSARIKKDI